MAKRLSHPELATAIALVVFSIVYTLSALQLKIGRVNNPGPGMMPLLVGLGLSATALVYLFRQIRLTGRGKETLHNQTGETQIHMNSLGVVLFVAAYPFLLAKLGFLIATSIVVYGNLLLMRYRTPIQSLFIGTVMAILCYLLFARLLGVVLPVGPAEEFLFKWF